MVKKRTGRVAQRAATAAGDAVADARARMAADPGHAARVEAELARLRIARVVRDLRERKKLTQGQLATLAGTKQPNIARLESGRVEPTIGLLEKVARALGAALEVRFRSIPGA